MNDLNHKIAKAIALLVRNGFGDRKACFGITWDSIQDLQEYDALHPDVEREVLRKLEYLGLIER